MLDAGYEPRPSVIEREFNQRYWGRSISFQGARQWLLGKTIPAQDKLQVLADWLQVEPHVLRFGGKALLSMQDKRMRWDAALAGPERVVLEIFITLPAPERKIVGEVILAFARRQV